MAEAVYAIEDFPDDDLLWRIEWIGGVGYNTSVPSDPQIEICLAQLVSRRRNESAQCEITFLSNKENSENRRWPTALHFDCFGMAAASTGDKGPRCQPPSAVHRHVIVSNGGVGGTGECYSQKQLPFGVSWPDVRRTLLVAVEQNGDPYAVMIPTLEIIRF
jgi:hypothetical protein